MIKNPTPSQYVMISFVAALMTIPTIYGIIWLVSVTNRPKPIPVVESLRCDAPANVDTTGWIEIPATPLARLRVPKAMRLITIVYPREHDPMHWTTPDGTLSVMIVSARRADPRWPQVRGRVLDPGDSGAVSGCLAHLLSEHPSSVETSRYSTYSEDGYYEVYSQTNVHADSVIRVTVHANSQQSQRTALAIVRSLRFVTAPPPT